MKRYVIERDIPGVGKLGREELKGVANTSNEALAKLGGKGSGWSRSSSTTRPSASTSPRTRLRCASMPG